MTSETGCRGSNSSRDSVCNQNIISSLVNSASDVFYEVGGNVDVRERGTCIKDVSTKR